MKASLQTIPDLCRPVCTNSTPAGYYGLISDSDVEQIERFVEFSAAGEWRWVRAYYSETLQTVAWHPLLGEEAVIGQTTEDVLDILWWRRFGGPLSRVLATVEANDQVSAETTTPGVTLSSHDIDKIFSGFNGSFQRDVAVVHALMRTGRVEEARARVRQSIGLPFGVGHEASLLLGSIELFTERFSEAADAYWQAVQFVERASGSQLLHPSLALIPAAYAGFAWFLAGESAQAAQAAREAQAMLALRWKPHPGEETWERALVDWLSTITQAALVASGEQLPWTLDTLVQRAAVAWAKLPAAVRDDTSLLTLLEKHRPDVALPQKIIGRRTPRTSSLPSLAELIDFARGAIGVVRMSSASSALALQLLPVLPDEDVADLHQVMQGGYSLRHQEALPYLVAIGQRDHKLVEVDWLMRSLGAVLRESRQIDISSELLRDALALLPERAAAYVQRLLRAIGNDALHQVLLPRPRWDMVPAACAASLVMTPKERRQMVKHLAETLPEAITAHLSVERRPYPYDEDRRAKAYQFGRVAIAVRPIAPRVLQLSLSSEHLKLILTDRNYSPFARQLLDVLPVASCYDEAVTARFLAPEALAVLGPRLTRSRAWAAAVLLFDPLERRARFEHHNSGWAGVTIARVARWDPDPSQWLPLLEVMRSNEQRAIAAMYLSTVLADDEADYCRDFAWARIKKVTNPYTRARLLVGLCRAVARDLPPMWDDRLLEG